MGRNAGTLDVFLERREKPPTKRSHRLVATVVRAQKRIPKIISAGYQITCAKEIETNDDCPITKQ